jgi:hypothetical protein
MGIFAMNRVNQIQVWSKFFGRYGVYEKHNVRVFASALGAASLIKELNTEKRGDEGIFESGNYFVRAEVGNKKGWVTYEVNPKDSLLELAESLDAAMQMHLGFYDEGETDKENAA